MIATFTVGRVQSQFLKHCISLHNCHFIYIYIFIRNIYIIVCYWHDIHKHVNLV